MIRAVFFPADRLPESFDLQAIAFQAQRAGLTLHSDGRRHALLPHPVGRFHPVKKGGTQ